MKKTKLLFSTLTCCSLLMVSCQESQSHRTLRELKEVKTALYEDLKAIRCREDLIKIKPHLEADFISFTDILIAICQLQEEGKISGEYFQTNDCLDDQLEAEFFRVLNIEGGREVLCQSQELSLSKLNKALMFKN